MKTALEGRVQAEDLYHAEQVRANRLRSIVAADHFSADSPVTANLVELILWLSIPYGTGDPVFEVVDPFSRQPLPENERLSRTWHLVVRGQAAPESPGMDPGGSEVIP